MDALYKKYNFPSAGKFCQILKENGVKATHKQVKEFIEKQSVAQVHKPVVHRIAQQQTITAESINQDWQIDLLDYSNYSTKNRGHKWILICIDVFSRKAYAEPLKTKEPNNILDAFRKILKQAGKPNAVFHDEGKEWLGVYKRFLKDDEINDFAINSKNHHSFGIVDRFSKTLKNMIEKHFTGNKTTNWISVLHHLVDIYNESPNSGNLNIKPDEAEKNYDTLSNLNFWKRQENIDIIKNKGVFKVGDSVRLKVNKNSFTKGYTQTYSQKVFKITEITGNQAKLDDGKKIDLKDVLKVPEGSLSVENKGKDKAIKDAMVNRKLRKEGLI